MSGKDTVNVPGGPAYVFGKKNTAHTGPESATNGSLDGGAQQSTADFVSAPVDDEEEAYDAAYDAVDDAFEDIELNTSSGYVHFTDESGRRMDYDEMQSDYAYIKSEGDDTSDLKMVLSFANTGDDFNDAVNAKTMGLDGGMTKIRTGWNVTDDNDVIIPVDDVVTGVHAEEIKEYTEAVNLIEEEGPVLSDSIAQELDYEAKKNSFPSVDVSTRINDLVDSDLKNHVHENGEISDEEEAKFLKDRESDYRDRLNGDTLSQAIDNMTYDGELDSDDLEYYAPNKSYSIDQDTMDRIFSRALNDN